MAESDNMVTFTPQMVTVFVEHEAQIARVLKRDCDLTVTEFCIIRELYLSGGPVDGFNFADFLMLRRNSISMALSSLEDKGYITKSSSKTDRRKSRITVTEKGIDLTIKATRAIYEAQESSFWNDLTPDEERSGNLVASLVLSSLRGKRQDDAAPLDKTHTPITPEFIVFCKAVPQMWIKTVKDSAGLSLSEFRILATMVSLKGSAYAIDLSRMLLLDRSTISASKDKLVEKGLIGESQDERDRRNSELRILPRGRQLFNDLNRKLQDVTNQMYSLCVPDYAEAINQWHLRMYKNMGPSIRRL